jgi:ribonuclease-3
MFKRKNPYQLLERRIGYRFKDADLLERALLHRSYRYEQAEQDEDNQRLEFLGDAVLGLAVATYLYNQHVEKLEGEMTALRSRVTSGKALSAIGRDIDLGAFIKIGKGEERSGGRERASNLADALEAIIGAAWLDGGVKATDKIFRKLFKSRIDSLEGDLLTGNPKGRLQELTQARWKNSPSYHVINTEGPPHSTVFYVKVVLPDGRSATGQANSKQKAEAAAARAMLDKINPQAD